MNNYESINNEDNIEEEPKINIIPEKGWSEKIFRDQIMIHDPALVYENISKDGSIKGAEQYIIRSFVLPGSEAIMVKDEKTNSFTLPLSKYYSEIGIGPKNFDFIEISEKYDSVLEEYLENINDIDDIEPLSITGQSKKTQYLIEKLAKRIGNPKKSLEENVYIIKKKMNIPLLRSGNVEPERGLKGQILTALANDDITLRKKLQKEGLKSINLEYLIWNKDNDIELDKLNKLIKKRGSVYVKTTGLASGVGVESFNNIDDIISFIADTKKKFGDKVNFIITEDISNIIKKESSLQFNIDNDGKITILGLTENIVENNEHQGNIVTSNLDNDINNIDLKSYNELIKYLEILSKDFKFNGYGGLDLAITSEGVKLLEVNARYTGATYPLAVLDQLRVLTGKDNLTVMSINTLKPKIKINNFNELEKIFGNVLLTKEKIEDGEINGVIPTLVSTLPEKMGIIIVGENKNEVKDILNIVKEKNRYIRRK